MSHSTPRHHVARDQTTASPRSLVALNWSVSGTRDQRGSVLESDPGEATPGEPCVHKRGAEQGLDLRASCSATAGGHETSGGAGGNDPDTSGARPALRRQATAARRGTREHAAPPFLTTNVAPREAGLVLSSEGSDWSRWLLRPSAFRGAPGVWGPDAGGGRRRAVMGICRIPPALTCTGTDDPNPQPAVSSMSRVPTCRGVGDTSSY